MLVQRLSETRRKGHTEEESRVAEAFTAIGIIPHLNQCVCFECSKMWTLRNETKFPSYCILCNSAYETMGMYMLPDIVIENKYGQRAVVEIFGGVHDEEKHKAKDGYKAVRLKQLGYKLFIVLNDEITVKIQGSEKKKYHTILLKNMNLRAMCRGFWDALNDDELYQKILKDEKEIMSINIFKTQ